MIEQNKINYDPESDILYFMASPGEIARSIEITPGITMELDEEEKIIGLEILHASQTMSEKIIASIHAKQAGII